MQDDLSKQIWLYEQVELPSQIRASGVVSQVGASIQPVPLVTHLYEYD